MKPRMTLALYGVAGVLGWCLAPVSAASVAQSAVVARAGGRRAADSIADAAERVPQLPRQATIIDTSVDSGVLACRPPTGQDANAGGAMYPVVFRPASATWYVAGLLPSGVQFGQPGDIPCGLTVTSQGGVYNVDPLIFRPSNARWYEKGAAGDLGGPGVSFGSPGDVPLGRLDLAGSGTPGFAVFRPSNGRWYQQGAPQPYGGDGYQFGGPGDIPVPGAWMAPGRYGASMNLGLFRPSTGQWFIGGGTGAPDSGTTFGSPGDIPIPTWWHDLDYRLTRVVFRPSTGTWYVQGVAESGVHFGNPGDVPSLVDWDFDYTKNLTVYRPSTGTWYAWAVQPTTPVLAKMGGPGLVFGQPGDIAVSRGTEASWGGEF